MNLLGNIVWLVFGGIFIFIEYILGAVALCLTIIGIPFGLQIFKLADIALWPFNKTIQIREGAPGCLSTVMNIIWIVVAGFWIVLTHLLFGILLGITIIGIPWARQHFKLMSLAVAPFGRRVIER
jgi:uncharacterized membrane protein YccF (DUF307 family)